MEQPLDGLRVVDTTNNRGELCGRLLADLGASVVLVEPLGGSSLRNAAPFSSDGESLGSVSYTHLTLPTILRV